MTTPNEKSFHYINGLDGLRALAVLAVIAYHLNIPYTAGGFLGVTVFFVLSGYLITSLLVSEWEQTQKIDLRQFWIRRAKRLLPACVVLLIVLNIATPLLRPELITNLRQDTIAATFYYSNWHYIFQELSYFEAFEKPSLLTHFWSLAIEEQFYIFWAVVILFFLKIVKSRKAIFLFILLASILSAVWMTILHNPNLDPSRVYYGTDTRIFSLLIGASFAVIAPRHPLTKLKKWLFEIMATIGLTVFLLMILYTNQYDSFVYEGGMALLSLTTACLVMSLALSPSLIVNKILEWQPLKWIGIRSYGIYLWHYPIHLFMNSNINTGGLNGLKIGVEITLTFLIAAISYTYVEKPIRQGAFRFNMKNSFVILTTVCLLLFFTNNNFIKENHNNEAEAHEVEGHSTVQYFGLKEYPHPPVQNNFLEVISKPPAQNNQDKTSTPPDQPKNQQPEKQAVTNNTGKTPSAPKVVTKKITAIGDSVLINPAPYLKKKFPNITIDAEVSRQMRHAQAIVTTLKKSNKLGEIVVIELGTNSPFPDKTLTSLIEAIGKDRKILLVNVRVPRPWESVVNKSLVVNSKKYSNTTVVDWYSTSANHNEYFVNDGVHLKPEGAKAYAAMIEKAIQKAANSK
jgi:peptidoglycan/LPS O-acetylase OafA/YrhL